MIFKHDHIVVTGGAGFIGTHVVEELNKRGHDDITIVSRISPDDSRNAYLKNLKFKNLVRPEAFIGDITTKKIRTPEIIIHLGARTDTSEKDSALLFRDNTLYTKKLFDYCVDENSRFIYASSITTYGDGSQGFSDGERSLKPLNLYALSKHTIDEFVLDSPKKPPQWVGLKFANVYGPRESHKGRMATMVYHGYKQILEKAEIKLFKSYRKDYGDGEQERDFIYVKDVVDVILFFLDHSDKSGIFNVGTGEARSFLDLSRVLFSILKTKPRVTFIDIPKDIRDAYQYHTKIDISKLRTAGYKKRFLTLEEGISEYVNNFLQRS